MRKMEIPHFEEFTKNYYPNFSLKNDAVIDAWLLALGRYSLNQCERAVTVYYSQTKTGYEPKPVQIKEIIEQNKPVSAEEKREAKPDCPLTRMKRDIELGTCRHNLYHYQRALKLLNRREVADFAEGLRESCRRMCGRDYEFPSKNDLVKEGLDKAKVNPAEVKYLFESFARRFSVGKM